MSSVAGAWMVVAAAICFSTKGVLAKLAYAHGADPSTVLALRMAFALPFFAVAALRKGEAFSRRELVQVFLLGSVGYYLAALFDFMGLAYVSAGLERLILYLYPTLVIGFNALLHRERPGPRLWQAVVLGYGGVALVVWSDGTIRGANVALGSALVFLGAIAYAFYLSGIQRLVLRHGSTRITSHALVVACLCALVFHRGSLVQPPPVLWLTAAIGVIATVLPAFLLSAGIKRLGSSRASLLGMIGPVSTMLLAYWQLGEPVTLLQLAGSALVLLGVYRASIA